MRTTLAILLAFTSACSQTVAGSGDDTGTGTINSTTPGGDNGDGLTISSFITQLDTADCAHAFSCKASWDDAAEGERWGAAYGVDEQDCLEGDADYQNEAAYQESVDEGRIVFDTAKAAECLGNLMFPSSCTEYFDDYDYPQACLDAIVGQVLPGNACSTTYDCYGFAACTNGVCH